jgi:hypothetical protein
MLTDPVTGMLCPTESTAYRIPDAIRRWVLARDRSCSHPGCDRSSAYCDLDHALDWPDGRTCPCNLTPLCRRHHNAKTHHRWQVRARLDGAHTTVSPTGRVYPTAADPPPGSRRDSDALEWEDIGDIGDAIDPREADDPGVLRILAELAGAA